MATDRRKLVTWLLYNGFTEVPRKATSHRQFTLNGFKFAVQDHGSPDIDPKIIDLLARNLIPHGFDPRKVKKELK